MATVFLMLIYLIFISLGLPDSLLGTVWPVMRLELGASLDTAGMVFIIISGGTIVSSLFSGRIIRRFGTGRVTAVSILFTAAALWGSSFSPSVWFLALMAVPLGLGGGAIDAALNNYVALHYAPRHMSWLHCFWGVGAFTGPLIIGQYLRRGDNWRGAYALIGIIQFSIGLLACIALPLWKKYDRAGAPAAEGPAPEPNAPPEPVPREKGGVFGIPGVVQALITFFLYCATEYTLGLWGASFLTEMRGFTKADAAGAVALYFAGITGGRLLTGFLTLRFSGEGLIRSGLIIITAGAVLLLLPLGRPFALPALLLIGFGCAPIYPSMIHLTPERFGPQNSPRIIGLQMACAYSGSTFVPPLAGFIAARTSMWAIPLFLLAYPLAMLFMSEQITRRVKSRGRAAP